ncbi:long-chain fatty acid--CoA ligase [Propionibacterium sp. NM47_B9-13]|jgi:long-chain acyl-CoA synthetase|uniref:Acyl-CoA synthetase n=2 Tax=Cutibacterium modestum TaxID=2559073 RepID=A0AAD1KQL5_9ACTN|nr:long-chain fatty acid--CoA ligase [Cutibacterium modestum]TGY30269.1 long-chain fatty acid--CoA ligase [Propionibacterium sp. NM47_B9-13]AOH45729.1 long-chain fatty acid--CoA ligase [Cutibacterium modestum]EFS74174.1 AMP-binding enzyme [Cutibacterium modestum HL037PA2]EFS92746.1 AMP-binding enzyme [Cutibacterium modestum HL044PA1]EFT15192.1 AMP-binding enzyme [Cutibacterium modestum HL037PA3]
MSASTHQPRRAELDPAGDLLGQPVPGENLVESHLAHMFRATVANHGFRPATRVRRGGQWIIRTYAETGRRVAGLARAFITPGLLTKDGLQRGDRISLFVGNCPEWIEADLAGVTVGVVPVPIYPTSTPDQIVHIVTDAGVRVIVTAGSKELDRILEARDQMPGLETVILIDPADQVSDHDGLTVLSLEQVRQAGVSEEMQEVVEERMGQSSADDVAALIYTSGTTGQPKGVMISHRAALAELQALDAFFDVTPADHSLSFLPLSHALEWGWSMVVIRHGCLNTFVPNPKTISTMLAEVRPTLFVSVPKLYEQVMKVAREKVSDSPVKLKIFEWSLEVGREWWQSQRQGRRVSVSLRARHEVADRLVLKAIRDAVGGPKTVLAAGGAPLRKEVEEFFAACGLLVCQGYGLTEASPLVSFNSPDGYKFGTAGKLLVGSQMTTTEEGEILYRGPNVMKGYWKAPEATAAAIDDGWLHTGDIGYLDEDGFLVITDRLKDIIVTLNGKNISPQPIESSLMKDPLFEHAVLLGDNRPCLTLLVKPSLPQVEELAERLHITSMTGSEMLRSEELAEEIRRRVAEITEKLPHQEQIRDLRVLWDEFTTDNGLLTPTLKVRRREVEKRFTEIVEEMYARLAARRRAGKKNSRH